MTPLWLTMRFSSVAMCAVLKTSRKSRPPPVPTTKERMPFSGSSLPVLSMGANCW